MVIGCLLLLEQESHLEVTVTFDFSWWYFLATSKSLAKETNK